jgi:hypothetical protein
MRLKAGRRGSTLLEFLLVLCALLGVCIWSVQILGLGVVGAVGCLGDRIATAVGVGSSLPKACPRGLTNTQAERVWSPIPNGDRIHTVEPGPRAPAPVWQPAAVLWPTGGASEPDGSISEGPEELNRWYPDKGETLLGLFLRGRSDEATAKLLELHGQALRELRRRLAQTVLSSSACWARDSYARATLGLRPSSAPQARAKSPAPPYWEELERLPTRELLKFPLADPSAASQVVPAPSAPPNGACRDAVATAGEQGAEPDAEREAAAVRELRYRLLAFVTKLPERAARELYLRIDQTRHPAASAQEARDRWRKTTTELMFDLPPSPRRPTLSEQRICGKMMGQFPKPSWCADVGM